MGQAFDLRFDPGRELQRRCRFRSQKRNGVSKRGLIEFAPGELTKSIELHIIGDVPEEDETFSVLLTNPVNAAIDTPSALIVIANDDQVPPRRRSVGH